MTSRALKSFFAGLVLLTIAPGAAWSQTPQFGLDGPRVDEAPAGSPLSGEELEERTREVASEIRCPVCQGLSVADSPVDSARAIYAETRELLALGYSEDQVLGYFERSYGEFIRLAPKPSGFNLVAWWAPLVAALVGLLLVVARIRNARKHRSPEPDDDPELAGYLDRVREEFRG